MSEQESSTVIHRKARQGRADFDARAMSPARALRLAVEASGDRLFNLPLVVRAVEQRRLAAAALGGEADSAGLIVLLDGPDGVRGAALFDPPLVQALIEVQTTGRVRTDPSPARAFTATDAAMTAPLIDAVMRRFAELLAVSDAGCEDDGEARMGTGERSGLFRFGDRVADARALALALGDDDLDLFRLTIDIDGGAPAGALALILPPRAGLPPDPGGTAGAGDDFDLAAVALGVPVTLDAVLARITMPLSDVWALKPGMILPVSTAALSRAELVAAGGHIAARARLGQMNGFRALRLTGPAVAGGQGAPPPAAGAAAPDPASLPEMDAPGPTIEEPGHRPGVPDVTAPPKLEEV